MAKFYDEISTKHQAFIATQKMFFVGTAAADGRVNISPKGIDTFRVLGHNKIIWLNLTGSGNETAIHLERKNRMTIMFCSFDENPLILRLYGQVKTYHKHEPGYKTLIDAFPATPGSRQIFEVSVDLVQTSCGFGVPLMEFVAERDTLHTSCKKKEERGIDAYWNQKNAQSIDGFKSAIFENDVHEG